MNKNIELEGAGIEKGKELFQELKDGCDGSYVGAETEGTFEFEGETYSVEICGFWESGSHFEYYIFGKGFRTTGTHSI
jgi:hypothetical protein